MEIGEKIKRLRIKNGLTQEELANRCGLSKGFISQLERDLTSPSIATLVDILQSLGTTLRDFFNETVQENIVFGSNDIFVKEDSGLGHAISWLIPNAQKNCMEPILMELCAGGQSETDDPHDGEEFGYILSGSVYLHLGSVKFKAKKGESFYFRPTMPHYIANPGKTTARILWVSTPPSF